MRNPEFEYVDSSRKESKEQIRKSLTYWKDAWRRLKKNRLAMVGMFGVILIILFGVVGPWFMPYSYSDQNNNFANIPPRLEIYSIGNNEYVYLSKQYNLILVSSKGELITKLTRTNMDVLNKI
jgi:oligopeptide transport system permease protein